MSIIRNIARLGSFMLGGRLWRHDDPHCSSDRIRACKFEQLEIRNPLTANAIAPIHLGSVYYEPASGDDSVPNLIRVSFQGGAAGTQLTQLVIDGDKDQNGQFSSGEVFFDTAPGGWGDFDSQPFQVDSADSTGNIQVTGVSVADGGQKLVINFNNFNAGDIFAFTIDVDEVQFIDPTTGATDTNAVVEGNEFQRSIMTGNFTAPHYQTAQGSALYWDFFDSNFATVNASSGTTLSLPNDSYKPPSTIDDSDFTAGAVLQLQQVPLPSSLSGTVYYDKNLSDSLDAGEPGIANVTLTLLEFDGTNWVSTGLTTTTDASGNYKFSNLQPGDYRVAETQPSGWLSVGSQVGTVDGSSDGSITNVDTLSDINLLGGQDGIHYNFGEALPNSISGRVWYDPQADCVYGPNDVPLSGVTIQLLDNQGNVIATTTTDQQGEYEFDGLAAGTYGVHELQPAGYLQGCTLPGSLGGEHNTPDFITQVGMTTDQHGTDYDFSELLPASISGSVADCLAGVPLSSVTVQLLDSNGNIIRTTTTDEEGDYSFTGLRPGETYGVSEILPPGYIHNDETLGSDGGVIINDAFAQITPASGVNATDYDFCDILPASIAGSVDDCIAGVPLSGVTVQLLDANGNIITTTTTDSQGNYKFTGLRPDQIYGVSEILPPGYYHNDETLGSAGGVIVNDAFSQVNLGEGVNATDYDFCDVLPSSISGKVWNDTNGNCSFQPGTDIPLSGVQIDLLDSSGTVIATTHTDDQGDYTFGNLVKGTYSVVEHQPTGYLQDMDIVGTINGVTVGANDAVNLLDKINLGWEQAGIDYNFCEVLPSSISGKVWNDTNGNCSFQPGTDLPLSGVQIDLLDSSGTVIATTVTDAQGNYTFDNLNAGTYSVSEHQPTGYLQDMDIVGTINGVKVGQNDAVNLLDKINLGWGQNGVDYNFCEVLPNSISGYVFQDGPAIKLLPKQPVPDVDSVRTGVRDPSDKPIAGVTILLYNQAGDPVLDSAGNPMSTVTDANGFYEFTGLDNGTYIVHEIQPIAYIDGIDTPGSTGGTAMNHNTPSGSIPSLPFNPNYDVIVSIKLIGSQHSVENNFSEIVVQRIPFIPPPPPPSPPPPQPILAPAGAALPFLPEFNIPPFVPPLFNYRKNGGDAIGYTWHLSIVNAGYPRGEQQDFVAMEVIAAASENAPWSFITFTQGEWILLDADGNQVTRPAIGIADAIPMAGDFRGDGTMELGLYYDGQWFIDTNGDGVWNAGDLWAKLGTRDDQPVVGDWDGDGKDDIGIFGPAWPRDPNAIQHDPGLPDPMNKLVADRHKKNVPPPEDLAAVGHRKLQAHGKAKTREEVIDHVFHYGKAGDRAIVGDWTGNGLRRVAVYNDGTWFLDMDGDGRWSAGDVRCMYGQKGDLPVIGDWTGDGIEKIGVYRNGTWYLDVNNTHDIADAKVVHLGQTGDKPVVGVNGGKAVIGVYRAGTTAPKTAEVPQTTVTK